MRNCRWEAVIATPLATMARQEGAFIGRRNELGLLCAALDDALAGRGRGIMMAGEPGIGKTRTARELADYAGRQGARVLWGRCYEEAGAPPYWPWVQIIRAALAGGDGEALLRELGDALWEVADIVPEIRARLSAPAASNRPKDPAEARFRMFDAIRQLLVRASERQALLILLDDLHWADAPSLRLMEFFSPEIADSRLLLVGTYRATELSRQHPLSDTLGGLARVSHVARISLTGLSAEEVGELIAAAAGTVPPAWFARTLHRQTEGNPLFLREIVRFLEQQGILSAGLRSPETALPPVIRIPEGLQEAIGRRLNLLSATCNEVLALAAVVGRDFAQDVLVHAARPLQADAVLEALDEALAAHVVADTGVGQYQFTHNLIRETLYDELRPAQRGRLHRAVGQAIETLRGADHDAVLPELARHFRAAGDLDRGLAYAIRAGERADAMLAFEEAASSFQMALDALEQQAAPDETLTCRLLLQLGEAERKSGDFQRARRTLGKASDVARRLGLHDLLAHAALFYERILHRTGGLAVDLPIGLLAEALRLVPESDLRLRVELSGGLARSLRYAGEKTEARERLDWAIATARRLGDPALLATILEYMFDFLAGPDAAHELLAIATEALEAAERSDNTEVSFMARGKIVICSLELGDIATAEAQLARLLTSRGALLRADYAVSLGLRAMLALMRGELTAAERLMVAADAQTSRTGAIQMPFFSMTIFSLRREQGRLKELAPVLAQFLGSTSAAEIWGPGLALLYVELDQLAEARAEFERQAASGFEDLPKDGRWITCIVYLSEVCAALGDGRRAAVLYRLLLPYADRLLVLGGAVCSGASGRHLGLLSAAMSRWAEAERHFEQALATNARIRAWLPLAQTQHDYAAMLLARGAGGDRERADGLLRSSLESAQRLALRGLEQRVGGRLQQLSRPASSSPAASDELTPREMEVLRLIAIGRSNADISTALSISLNTVATHVRSILAKTGCANRTEAAAYALQYGLAAAAAQR
jgi:DNA-binding CsgD family transcriptional regulator